MCCCWFHPSFRYKIDPQENNNPRVKHLHFGINCEGKNILQWKCWRWGVCVRGAGGGKMWPFPIGRRLLSSYLGHLHLLPTFTSTTFHNKTIEDSLQNWQDKCCEAKWLQWIIALLDEEFSLPALGSSTLWGVAACIEIYKKLKVFDFLTTRFLLSVLIINQSLK